MPVQHSVTFTAPEGQPFVSLNAWVATLSPTEQAAYATAKAANDALIESRKTAGKIIETTTNSVVYDDAADAELHEQSQNGQIVFVDPTWKTFLERYLSETGVTMTRTLTNI